MESLGIDWKILIGQIINFAILLFILKKFALKPILSTLENRRKKIEDGLKKSEEAEKSLLKIREMSENIKQKREKEAEDLLKETEKKAKERATGIIFSAEDEKKSIIEKAKASAAKEIEEKKKEQEKRGLEIAFVLAEKILDEKIDKEKDKKIIEKVSVNLE